MKKTKVEEKGVVKEEAKGEPGGARRRENWRQKRREKRVERKKEMKRKMVVNPAPGRANDHVKAPKVSLYSAHSVETLPVLELYPSPCRQPAIMLPLALEMKGGLKGGATELPLLPENISKEYSELLTKISEFLFKIGDHLTEVSLEMACPRVTPDILTEGFQVCFAVVATAQDILAKFRMAHAALMCTAKFFSQFWSDLVRYRSR